MATKRHAPSASDGRHESHNSFNRRPHKRPRFNNAINPSNSDNAPPKSYPVNELKSQIRALRRLLSHHDNLPATVRVEKERALSSAEHQLGERQRAKRRSEMIERFHKVRFFDRQKATRRLKKARKERLGVEGTSNGEVEERLRRKVEDAEVDVNYALYSPLDWAYVSLFPTKRKGKGVEDADTVGNEEVERQGDPVMWTLVKQCMAEGTLKSLREGRISRDEEDTQEIASEKAKHIGRGLHEAKSRGHGKVAEKDDREESDNESGGGFFE